VANLALSFGGVTIPNVTRVFSNFGDSRTLILPISGGVGGGFDQFGIGEAPTEIGRVEVDFLLSAAEASMQASIDAINALPRFGRSVLFFQPQGSLGQRFCYARVASIYIPEDAKDGMVWIKCRVTFAVSEPRWYRNATVSPAQACTGVLTEWTVTYSNGNARAIPVSITIVPPAGKTITDPILRRRLDGVLMDEVSYSGTIPALTTLGIYVQSMRVTVGGVDAYSAFDFLHPDWFRLSPGANTLQLIADNAGDEATVTVNYRETYR
jgi:hypothetical protein